jgi:hypothetical protein
MSLGEAFDAFQEKVDADPTQVKEARARRETFKGALGGESDVVEVWGSGSLRRSTHIGPKIHDLDLVVIFKADAYPGWGEPGESAGEALSVLGSKVNKLLGVTNGTVEKLVRIADPRNHAVKCFIDMPGDDDGFTVDAMPALKHDGALLIPEKNSGMWVPADPMYLVREIAKRSAKWEYYLRMIRVLRRWGRDADVEGKVKSNLRLGSWCARGLRGGGSGGAGPSRGAAPLRGRRECGESRQLRGAGFGIKELQSSDAADRILEGPVADLVHELDRLQELPFPFAVGPQPVDEIRHQIPGPVGQGEEQHRDGVGDDTRADGHRRWKCRGTVQRRSCDAPHDHHEPDSGERQAKVEAHLRLTDALCVVAQD